MRTLIRTTMLAVLVLACGLVSAAQVSIVIGPPPPPRVVRVLPASPGAEFVWVPDEQLLAQGVRQWSEMPLWRTFPGVWQVSSAAAQAEGLSCRPLAVTVDDTWSWMRATAVTPDDERASEIGISRERERQILARVA